MTYDEVTEIFVRFDRLVQSFAVRFLRLLKSPPNGEEPWRCFRNSNAGAQRMASRLNLASI